MAQNAHKLLIRGGRVYDHDGDVHDPARADILIEGADIALVEPDLPARRTAGAEVIDATGHLVIPGLVNAHYHSHDTLCRGLFEELPLEMWLLYTLPMGGHRSKCEVRLRTLVGALESLRSGITTVQDMLGLIPLSEDYLDVVIAAYEEIGARVVFSPMVFDIPAVAMLRFKDMVPADVQEMLGTAALGAKEQIDFLSAQIARHPAQGTLHWALGPFAPQRCSPELLAGCADLAERHDLGIYIHVYETRGQVLMAREDYADYGGSFITYLDKSGLLTRRLNIAHSIWLTRAEMERMAAADAGAVLNHLSNMKLKSGVAPVLDMREAGMRVALGCDNCSGSDVQNMFQAMKMYCLLAAVSDPEPGPPLAHEALRLATLGGARSAMLEGRLGAVKPGHRADLVLLDMKDIAYLPYNSAARQLVYTETGRSIDTVIVEGRVVIKDRRVQTIDEDDLRAEVADLMEGFRADFADVVESRAAALPHLLKAHRRVWESDVGLERFIARTRR
ncbi:MAG: amidohydrolase family protein [Alphaproteobacteria bacterium]|nr:amidohydrolase family protein [Alphaproteobacteria bacterium]